MSKTPPQHTTASRRAAHAHWHANRRLMASLLSVWFVVSYLFGIVFVEPLNTIYIGGFPLGFWFAQQGSIYCFVVLTLIYAIRMDRIDRQWDLEAHASAHPSSPPPEPPE